VTILGIDFGLKKIGLAMAEDGFVSPLRVIANSSQTLEQITILCKERSVQKIILGRSDNKLFPFAESFARILEERCHLPVEFQDETLTTNDAIERMITLGKKRKFRQEQEDAVSAALILEEYLAKNA